jgi:hypothetical protein
MPGINELGTPNTLDYVLGRGKAYFAENDPSTGLPVEGALRDLGNVTAFASGIEVETRDHKNSRDCLAQIDATFVLSQKVNLSFSLDEINFENLSDFFSGSVSTFNNQHDVTSVDVVISDDVILGRWYELRAANGQRVYNLDATGCVYTIEKDGAPDVLLVEGTDYEIDEQLGLVFVKTTATNIAAGDQMQWSITTGATTPQDLDQVRGLQRALVEGTLLFIWDNANNCGQKVEVRFHRAQLTGDGELPMIGDEETVASFSGVAGINSFVDATSPFSIRTYEMN